MRDKRKYVEPRRGEMGKERAVKIVLLLYIYIYIYTPVVSCGDLIEEFS